jgi:hypothetical protein
MLRWLLPPKAPGRGWWVASAIISSRGGTGTTGRSGCGLRDITGGGTFAAAAQGSVCTDCPALAVQHVAEGRARVPARWHAAVGAAVLVPLGGCWRLMDARHARARRRRCGSTECPLRRHASGREVIAAFRLVGLDNRGVAACSACDAQMAARAADDHIPEESPWQPRQQRGWHAGSRVVGCCRWSSRSECQQAVCTTSATAACAPIL